MPKPKNYIPRLSRHVSGAAFVKVAGHQIWLGRYGDALTREKYDRCIAEWLARGRRLPVPAEEPPTELSITALVLAYWAYAKTRYSPSQRCTIKSGLRLLRRHYGSTPAVTFGPKKLRALRAAMVAQGWARTHIGQQVTKLRAVFKWAAAQELLPAAVYDQLATLEPLRRGEAKERPPVRPAPRRLIRGVRRHLPLQLRAAVDLQLLTGARPGEILKLRPIDLDRRGSVWTAQLLEHKTEHHGKERVLYFGPRAQRVLRLLIDSGRPLTAAIFSPQDAERARHDRAPTHRRPNQRPSPRCTDRRLGERYTPTSYRRAITRACDRAFPPPAGAGTEEVSAWRARHRWHPNQLRHNSGTFLRREFGVEVARVILGHSSLRTTEIYAELDRAKAIRAMSQSG